MTCIASLIAEFADQNAAVALIRENGAVERTRTSTGCPVTTSR